MLKVEVYRYNPDTDSAPKMESFDVDTGGKDLMVLDVLALIKERTRASRTVVPAVKAFAVPMA